MSSSSSIEWTDATWNPVTGCDRVSPGCAHCYALELAPRLRAMGNAKYERANDGDSRTSGPAFGVTLHPDELETPLRWRKPRMVFVNSMSDLFHEAVPDGYIERVFEVMELCSHPQSGPVHTFQILTKRPERMRDFMLARQARKREYAEQFDCLPSSAARNGWRGATSDSPAAEDARARAACPPANIWLGVSIENRRFVGRADVLRETPAAVRFVSAEPLLGPLVFDSDMGMARDRDWPGAADDEYAGVPEHLRGDPYEPAWLDGADLPELDLTRIDWLIVGGESGSQHRRMDPQWVRDLRDACGRSDPCLECATGGKAPDAIGHWTDVDCPHCGGRGHFGTAFFFKQWGGRTPKAGGRELDGRTWDEMPAGVGATA